MTGQFSTRDIPIRQASRLLAAKWADQQRNMSSAPKRPEMGEQPGIARNVPALVNRATSPSCDLFMTRTFVPNRDSYT